MSVVNRMRTMNQTGQGIVKRFERRDGSCCRYWPIAVVFLVLGALPRSGWAIDPAVLVAEAKRIEVSSRLATSVVAIFSRGGRGGGSGVLISSDGYALTNFHVTRGAGTFMKCGLNDGQLYDAVIVGIDPTGDVALIKLLGRDDFPHATLGDSDTLRVGDWTFAMGNPFLLATDFQPTVTYGIVSGLHRYQYPAGTILEYTDCIQVDTSINPGNSGGPLFSADGQLVGINGRGSFEKRGRVNSGAGYAISINQIKLFMDHLRSGRVVDHATLGATVATREDGAVVVDGILDASEAFRRGLREGDEIVSFAGRSVRSVNQFKNILGIYPKGWKLPLVFRRDGVRTETLLRLRALHRASELAGGGKPKPRPGDKPGGKPGGKPGDKPGDKKKRPGQPPRRRPAVVKPPEKYKHLYVKKSGFANYYFNQLEQKRTLSGMSRLGDFAAAKGTWVFLGTTEAGDAYQLTLADSGVGLSWKQQAYFQELSKSAEPLNEPKSSGGLLYAMHMWRSFLMQRERVFGEFYYLGSEPLDGSGPRVDVMISELGNVRCRWYFDRKRAQLLGWDCRIEEETDECEVRFGGEIDSGGRRWPKTITVRSAGSLLAKFAVETVTIRPEVSR